MYSASGMARKPYTVHEAITTLYATQHLQHRIEQNIFLGHHTAWSSEFRILASREVLIELASLRVTMQSIAIDDDIERFAFVGILKTRVSPACVNLGCADITCTKNALLSRITNYPNKPEFPDIVGVSTAMVVSTMDLKLQSCFFWHSSMNIQVQKLLLVSCGSFPEPELPILLYFQVRW